MFLYKIFLYCGIMPNPVTMKQDIVIRGIKMLDIGYVAVIYFALGMFLAKLMDYFYGDFDPVKERKKATYRILMEAAGMLWLNGIMVYIVRNLVSLIPFPLNGVYGFDHLKVKELTNATVFVYAYLYFQKTFQEKMKYIYNNVISGTSAPVAKRHTGFQNYFGMTDR